MRAIVVLSGFCLLATASLHAQARYTVRVDDPATQILHVTAELPSSGESTVVSLPAWTPGHYTIGNYARYVSGFAATDEAGDALEWEKLDPDSWRIASAGADRVRVSFDFFADTVNLSGSLLKDDFGFLNGTNLFVYPDTGVDFASEVAFELPDGWRVATGLTQISPGRYTADAYDELVDAPTFLGAFGIDSLEVDGVPIRLAVYPAEQIATEYGRLSLDALGKVAEYLHDFWGEAPPYESYTMLIYLESEPLSFGGGLEHANSHLDILPIQAATPQAFPGLYSLYSHEYVHAWNVKRIRPADMWPYEYDEWQPTPLLWVSEGITDYYGDIVLERTGIWSADELWSSFAEAAQTVAAAPPYSVEDSSLETWIDTIEVSSQYYYAKGKLLGFLLDAMIRDATDGASSLDDVMRRLYRERYEAGRGFTTEDVLDFVDDLVEPARVRDFYERYVDGRDPLPYADVLARIGVAYEERTGPMPFLGVGTDVNEAGEFTVTDVTAGSPAEAADLRLGDVLLAIGDVPVTLDADWGAAFRERYAGAEGQPLALRVRRDGAETTLEATVRTRPRTDITIASAPDADARAARLREGLLSR